MLNYKNIKFYTQDDFKFMQKAGFLAAEVLDFIQKYINAGVTTNYLNNLCHKFILKKGAIPAPLHYKHFPKSICTSINHVVCHGVPSKSKLYDGDLINIDITIVLDGWYGDTSRMYYVGKKNNTKGKLLSEVTYNAMLEGISVIKPGVKFSKIGKTIESYAKAFGYSVVKEYCGHGIGKQFHDLPNILHYEDKKQALIVKKGMFFTVEPMVNIGKEETKILSDHWTVVTQDNQLSAQFEHTIGVNEDGHEIFTRSIKKTDFPVSNE